MSKLKMKIYIEHLHYTVYVKQPNNNKPSNNAIAWVESLDTNSCTLYIKQPIKNYQVPTLAHELVHVLQYISEDRRIHFAAEKEHFGYLMQWLMSKIMGFKYND